MNRPLILDGLTIVPAGISKPEVALGVTTRFGGLSGVSQSPTGSSGERDIAVGKVVGSNTFNTLDCLGLSALVSDGLRWVVAPSVLACDAWVGLAVALACRPARLPVIMTGPSLRAGTAVSSSKILVRDTRACSPSFCPIRAPFAQRCRCRLCAPVSSPPPASSRISANAQCGKDQPVAPRSGQPAPSRRRRARSTAPSSGRCSYSSRPLSQ